MSMSPPTTTPQCKQSSALLYFLGFVTLVFIGILVFAYVVTRRSHPVYVDEHGRPVNAVAHAHRQAK